MNRPLYGTQPTLCSPIIRQVDQRLIHLLSSLTPEEWELPTIAPRWCVRDVAAHLLDTALRKLSAGRDRHHIEKVDIRTPQDVVVLVDRLNHEGVNVYRRLSPPVLTQLMQLACAQTADYYESLDPFATAAIASPGPARRSPSYGSIMPANSPSAGTISSRFTSPPAVSES